MTHMVEILESVWIPMPDGRRLHARIYLPKNAATQPVPAVLHYHPYPLDWFTRGRDDRQLVPLAAEGFACVRVDMSGSGASEGLLRGEYLDTEIDDGIAVLAWISAQSWCNGVTGVMGSSWSGCNALQIAARAPPSLRAVISCDSTDDHYRDDIHYVGGAVCGLEMLNWGVWCHVFSVSAPDPRYVGDAWRERWIERLSGVTPAIVDWLAHPRRDGFWKATSIAEDYAAHRCPVLVIGGWGDGYRSAVFRVLEAVPEQVWALVGPWCHGWPNSAQPGPQLDMAAIMARWWRHWLKGDAEGIERDARLVAFVEESRRPYENRLQRLGRWHAFDRWVETPQLVLDGARSSAGGAVHTVAWHHEAGASTGLWCPYGQPDDQAADQRGDDALVLSLDWPLEEAVAMLGAPRATLTVSVDAPVALIAARLCDVAPDGSSTLITDGVLNLCHRNGHEELEPMPVGEPVKIEFPLRAAGYCVPAGHRLRLALSSGAWPMAWPSPTSVRLTVDVDRVALALPLATKGRDASPIQVPPLHETQPAGPRPGILGDSMRSVTRRFADGAIVMRSQQDNRREFEDGLVASEHATTEWTSFPDEPLRASNTVKVVATRRRGAWETELTVEGSLQADAKSFRLRLRVCATSGPQTIHDQTSEWTFPRDLG